jgi:putative ABC transport system permease protein
MLISTITEGLIFSIMVLGIYISYKILDFPDLTVDGSFALGAAVISSSLISGIPLGISLILTVFAGSLAGLCTGYIHTKFEITNLLSGILVMIGLYSINLRIMGRANVNLFSVDHLFSRGNEFYIILCTVLGIKLIIDFFFKTKMGFIVRLVGDNPNLIGTLGLDAKKYKIIGLMISNSLVALSGGLLAQYQGFADISMGTGMLVIGLASIILGETIFRKFSMVKLTTAAIVGSMVYRYVLALSLKLGFAPSDLKLLTAVILLGILVLNKREIKILNFSFKRIKEVKSSCSNLEI